MTHHGDINYRTQLVCTGCSYSALFGCQEAAPRKTGASETDGEILDLSKDPLYRHTATNAHECSDPDPRRRPVVYILNQLRSQVSMMSPKECLCEALRSHAWPTADLYTNLSGCFHYVNKSANENSASQRISFRQAT